MGGEAMDIHTAVQEVLKNAMVVDGLVRGLREAVKALDKRKAHLCILAANCDEPSYVKLVEALCVEHNIPMFKVSAACCTRCFVTGNVVFFGGGPLFVILLIMFLFRQFI